MSTPTTERSRASPSRWAEHESLLVREVLKRLGRSLDPADAVREMLHLLSELLGLNRGRVLLYDAEADALVIRYAYGLTQAEIRRGRFAPGEGVTGRVFRTREPAIVQDIDAEPAFLCRTVERSRLPQETVAYIALPIESDGRVVGVLGVHRLRRRDRALADDLAILRMVATLVGQVLQIRRLVERETAALATENRALKAALERAGAAARASGIVGDSPRVLAALAAIERVAPTDASVLLLGESGTGKELFARALHLLSPRRDRPFVKVNCAAIPDALFESELFGHEKGAFTGATAARPGKFELADGGTLFLDEVGELPLAMQAKLLRALQERVVERVGATRERRVDVRIVAATNRDLQGLVSAGSFRLDLFYRLNVVPVTLPALRERPDDVRALARHFASRLNQAYQRNVTLSQGAVEALARFPWPGNVRQLANVLERIVLLNDSGVVGAGEVERVLAAESRTVGAESAAPRPAEEPARFGRYRAVSAGDRDRIENALAATRGNKSAAAQHLGMTLRQLEYRIKQLGIDPARHRR
ncbi:MAG: sigma 54-interacting transcriptional regulator [Burkholderiales bacterium]|nr:sigma 54-interacting transcriptional regulator [Burkholderiales bacterium]